MTIKPLLRVAEVNRNPKTPTPGGTGYDSEVADSSANAVARTGRPCSKMLKTNPSRPSIRIVVGKVRRQPHSRHCENGPATTVTSHSRQ
jgi:hypothetical protein